MQTVSSYSYDMLVNWYKVMSTMVSLIWWYWNNTKCKDDWLCSLFNSGIFRSYQNCVCGSFTDCCCNWEVPYLALSNPVPVCLNSRVMIGLSSFDGILQSNSGANDKCSKSVWFYFWNVWGRCCCWVRLFDTRVTGKLQLCWSLPARIALIMLIWWESFLARWYDRTLDSDE